ncbi:MAG: hypothetical protein KC416_06725 [Myxococcales bacterium]|nr:hypothetical protein [Myxococcales bacterium]
MIEIDDSRWPLLVATLPAEPTLADLDSHFERLVRDFFPRGRFAGVVDASALRSGGFPAGLRRHSAELYSLHADLFAKGAVAEAFVIVSPLQRGMLTAIQWLAPNTWPRRSFATRGRAQAWCLEQLARNSIPAP